MSKAPLVSLDQEGRQGHQDYQVMVCQEPKENQAHKDTQELESRVCQGCQENQGSWGPQGQEGRWGQRGRLGPWGYLDRKDHRGLMGFLA